MNEEPLSHVIVNGPPLSEQGGEIVSGPEEYSFQHLSQITTDSRPRASLR